MTKKVFINDINNLPSTRYNNRFYDILVDRYAWISGIIGGDTGLQTLKGLFTAIVGGQNNMCSGDYSTVAGGERVRLSGSHSFIGGGLRNVNSGLYAVIGGGSKNTEYAEHSFIGGGESNVVSNKHSAVVGGTTNIIYSIEGAIVGGALNTLENTADNGFIGGGVGNRVIGDTAVVVGGDNNKASGGWSFVGGGLTNQASGIYSTCVGGNQNSAMTQFSNVMGRNSVALHDGATVLSDARGINKVSAGQNTFTLDFSGGAWITGGGLNARRGFNLFPTGDVPTSSTPGRSGDFAIKDDYIYAYTGDPNDTNRSWGRVKLSSLTAAAGGQSIVSNKSSIVIPGGSPYTCTNAFANVTHAADPWNPIPQNPSITVPAGNFTYLFDCQFLAKGGAGTEPVHYRLWNTTDGALINNSSGLLVTHSTATIQRNISTIVTLNYAASKTIDLQAFDGGATSAQIIPTGGFLRYIILE